MASEKWLVCRMYELFLIPTLLCTKNLVVYVKEVLFSNQSCSYRLYEWKRYIDAGKEDSRFIFIFCFCTYIMYRLLVYCI